MPELSDKQYLLIVTFHDGEQSAYMFFQRKSAMVRFENTENDCVKFSVAVFECGKCGSVFEKIAERRPMNVAR